MKNTLFGLCYAERMGSSRFVTGTKEAELGVGKMRNAVEDKSLESERYNET